MESMAAERGMTTSTPSDPKKTGTFTKETRRLSDIPAAPFPIMKKAIMIDMITEAIEAVALPRKGASYQAIKKWILANKLSESSTFNRMLKKAVLKGIEAGVLIRPRHSINANGATGSFALSNKVNKPTKKAFKKTTKKADMESPQEAAVKPRKANPVKSLKTDPVKTLKKDQLKTLKNDPAKNLKKDPLMPLKKDPVKTLKKDPVKTLKKDPVKTLKKDPVKTLKKDTGNTLKKDPVKTLKKEPVKTLKKDPVKPLRKDPAKPLKKATEKTSKDVVTKSPKKVVTKFPKGKTIKTAKNTLAKEPLKGEVDEVAKSSVLSSNISVEDNSLVLSFSESEEESPEGKEQSPEVSSKGKARTAKVNKQESVIKENESDVKSLSSSNPAVNRAAKKNAIDKDSARVKRGKEFDDKGTAKQANSKVAGASKVVDVVKDKAEDQIEEGKSRFARSKKLYTSGPKRKDLSDTELDVIIHRPKSLKSYSSDTELEISKRQEPKEVLKGRKLAKVKTVEGINSTKKTRKGIDVDANVEERDDDIEKESTLKIQNQTKTRKGR